MKSQVKYGGQLELTTVGVFEKVHYRGSFKDTFTIAAGNSFFYVSIDKELSHLIELDVPYKLKMKLFGSFKYKPNGEFLNNHLEVIEIGRLD